MREELLIMCNLFSDYTYLSRFILDSFLSDIRKCKIIEKVKQLKFPLTMKKGYYVIPTNGAKLTASCQYNKIIFRIPGNVKPQSKIQFYCI